MSIKHHFARLAEKITGRKCSRCYCNTRGRCCHPDGNTFMRCYHSMTRPGFKYSESKRYANEVGAKFAEGFLSGLAAHNAAIDEETRTQAPGDLTPEEKHQLGKIVESLQEASTTAQDAGLLDETEPRPIWEDKTESGLLEED